MIKNKVEDIYQLSPMQQGILFHSLYAPEDGVYFEQLSCVLQGNLNVLAFERAWQQVVARHQALRTAFIWERHDKPLQVVYRQVKLPLEIHDWRRLSPIEQQQQLEAFLQSDRGRGFKLSQAPLMRLTLIQVDDNAYQFVWSHHHLLMDGWSLPLVLSEVFAVYEALYQNQDLYLKPSRPYRDYISWLQKQNLANAEVFWRQVLKGFTAPTPLAVNKLASSEQGSYSEQQIHLTVQATAALQSLARQHQLTLNTLLEGAWALLLSRYSGEADVVFGVTVSGRLADIREVESIVGLFINTLPMRVQVSPEDSLLSWLKQIQNQLVEIRQYEYSGLVQVQGWSEVPRGLPLFESIVVFENYPVDASLRKPGRNLEVRDVRFFERTNYPLTVVAVPGDVLSLRLGYDCQRFDAATIARMLGHFQTLLTGMAANPNQRLSELPLLSAVEQHQLLVEWNDTKADYPQDVCIHQLFEATVTRSPDALAVIFVDALGAASGRVEQQLTYLELNCRANKVAHYLRTLGVGPDVLVGICMERSLLMLIAMLGILKAGGAYVPLDPAYPQQRLAFMLEDAAVPVLLTQERLVSKLESHEALVVCLDTDWDAIAQQSSENPKSNLSADNLAYVIYTSGSTGKPKGVQISHGAVVNFLSAMQQQPGITAQDVLLAVTTITFDIAALELFLPITVGACLEIVSREVASDGTLLLQLVNSRATVMQATPATWRLLLAAGWQSSNQSKQLKILCGGEALPRKLANQLRARGTSLWNLYGPTETTIWSVISKVESELGLMFIGRPIANTQVYLLDSQLQPVPIGIKGEFYIGGDGLARGYLNRPELTAQRFIPNPFSNKPGACLYKTGDLARYNSDGNIEYLGRIDHQVKIRGFRIELGEIEAVLSQHPAVLQTIVIAREDVPGDQRLVAYLVPHQEAVPVVTDLRYFLKQQLPEHQVPSAFVMLDALPLTPNGKVDRSLLPAPDTSRHLEAGFVTSRTPTEEVLAVIWADILGLEQVDIYDSLFELGGHSLLATQIISRVRDTFSVELPLRRLFESPTVAGLSEQIQVARRENQSQQVPSIQPIDREGELPLSFAQTRLWFLDQLEGGSATYNMPAALHFTGPLHIAALEMAMDEIVRRHEVLRTSFPMVKGSPVQVVSEAMPKAFAHPTKVKKVPLVDLQSLPEVEQSGEVQKLASEEAQRPFDLSNGPLLRVTLLQLGEESHVLLTTIHHIVFDGWSVGVFIREMATLYQAFLSGQPSPLPELPIQYADFAHWQRQWLSGEVLETQLNYWQQQLAGAPPVLELPTDRPHPPVQTFRGGTKQFQLNTDLTRKLLTLSQKSGATLYMTLLAAFAILLSRYSGQEDIVVGSPIANRNRSETESLIGFFLNTLLLRTDLQGNPTFAELLDRVRQVTLDAYAHQDVPFEQLVEALQPERHLSHSLWFQVLFVLQNAPMGSLELPGITLTPLEIENSGAKFDLTLSMAETQQGLMGWLEYKTDLFDAATITRMAGHFQALLEGIAANPQQRVSEFPLLTEAERHQLLVKWNDTFAEYPQNKCIHQLFEAQVERTPDAPAVEFVGALGATSDRVDQQLTYRELNCRANKVAHHLQALGVGPEVLVGLCVNRSIEMVVGLLGILKAGGAYVPLDPVYPKERLANMMSDSQVSVLLTQEQLVAELPSHGAHVVCLDTVWQLTQTESEENPVSGVTPENLAYVIYTSGSIGKPKGVMIQHQSLVSFTETAIVEYELTERDRVLQFASISFDTAAEEIYPCLTSGGTLVLRTDEMLSSVPAFLEKCREMDLTVLDLPTAYWHQLTSELALSNLALPAQLRLVIIGGEQALPERVGMWRLAQGAYPQLVNTYGPTEATIVATLCKLSDSESAKLDGQEVPIGRTIRNVQVYVLDQYLQPVPIGVKGELHIGGSGLARGYLNRPDLTEATFIPNPFSDESGARLYKTGDLARYLSDGNIEYLGRIDHQVKIRGFRIELGEIETVLSQHPSVRETVVIAREDTPGDKRLVAYIVPSPEITCGAESPLSQSGVELRRFLKELLPNYMVPSAFVMLEALPLTPNGKVDRRALPSPDTSGSNRSATSVAPRTPTEEVLTAIWAEVLRVEVGIQDNFFELGGHSLLASQVISRVRDAFCVDLPLRCLFESPTVAELGEAISASRHQRPDLQVQAIEPVSRDAELPLSFAQARLWFLDQLEGQSASYNMPAAMRLQGPLHVAALEMAVQEIVQRHEVLCTTFEMVNGSPVQAIAYPTKAKKVPLVDLQSLAEVEQSALVQRLVIEEQSRPFDLATGPLLRVTLLRLGEDSHVLLLTMHHIISDGWSMGIFIREVAALYAAFSKGALSPLPELPIQYADFAHWQRQWLSGEVLKTQLKYWQQQLAGAVPVLDLPTDRPRPPVQTFQGGSEQFQLNADLTRKLLALSQQSGATLFMTMLAAFVTLLSRYSDRDDIVVGSPIANRNRRETESLIGCFVNTLVLRTDLSGNPSFEELLRRVRQVALDAYAHQDVPFEQLVEALQPERSLSHTPIFQVMFVLQNAPMGELELPDLTLTPLTMESSSAKFDLTLTMIETQQGLLGSWEYNSDLFDPTTITRMVGHFQTLLESIVANPQQYFQDLPLLSAAQRHQILVEWNDTQVNYPQDKCIHHLFEAQVERNPDRVAVVFKDSLLTYRDLNCRANKIAHYLKTLGVGPDVLVGLCVERSLDMVIGLLGILKAGGTYIPLDPAYPQERLANMMSDAQVPVLLTQQQLVATLPEHRAEVICLDSDLQSLAQESDSNPLSGVTTKNLAYVIYTSGSTGKPKGVQIPHCAVANFLNSMRLTPGLTDRDILLSVTTLSFDIAALELFLPLTVGASVVLVSRQVASNGSELLQQLWRSGATVMQATPATWRLLLEAGWQGSQKLKILCGGEALQRQLANELHQRSASLWNLYGPTETTIWSTIHQVDDRNGAVSIGRPIANTQVYVLDRHLQPVPIGIPGELYIGGNGLAKGYLNRPDLTEEKFIPNPFNNQPGARLYKTGDLVRYLPDGNIEFLGRLDNQVKIRGFRIELGEISSVLAQHPGIRETIVIAPEDVPGNQRLVAYLVPNQEPAPTITDLRRFLKKQLPEYMVPSAFVMLDTLPLTPNGKVDRSLLPAPEIARPELEATFSAPQTPVEEMLAGIWASVLGVEQVGIHDNFFELGGHSLLATQVISQVRATLGVELPLRSLFEAPTVAGLAKCVQTVQSLGKAKAIVAPPLYPVARDGEMPLSFAQARLWFLDQLEPGSGFYNMPGAVLINGQLNVRALERSLNEIIKRHETLRSNVQTVDGQPVQVIAETRNLTLSVVNLQSLPESERLIETLRLATAESQRPFDLANDPLIRATLLKVGEADHVFLLTIHHIIFDGWSGGVFFRELAALYSAFCNDLPSLLPELPIQYADFAVWQRQWLQGEVLEAHLSYWKQQLNGAPALLELPTDRPRPAVQTFWGAHQFLGLSQELSQALRNLSQRQGVTLFMTVLAAFQTLLYRYTGQTDVIVGAPIANRNFAQVEELIGFFANTLVLRTEMSGNPSFRELLMRVREVALGAYAYQYVPFEQLIDALQPERDVSHTPLFQVMFVLHNAPVPSVEFKGLNFTPLGIESGTAKFDLTLALTNTEQGLIGGLEYNTDLFDATTITRMQGHLQTLLEGIVANPEQRLLDLPLLTAAERDQLLVEWNRTKTDEPQDACICQMFEAQVQKTPDAIAVVFENQQLTYRELNYRANQLAHHLQSLGVGSEVLVGIYVERSLLMVVGLLGILKAGGAYVPLDPTYPPERLAYMLLDAQVSVLLTQEKWVSQLPEHQAKVICLDSDWVRIAFYSQENPTQEARGKDLAYIIYTSGSTGKPKGVMIPYKALANFTQIAISEYAITHSDRVLQFASISFDAAAEEIYPCLCAGGTLVLRTDAMLSVLWAFLKTCQELQLTVLNLPTAYWHQLTAELAITDVPLPESLRLVIIGGERALPKQVHSWQQYVTKSGKGEQLQLINTYGPTEATVTATLYRVPPTSITPQCEVPIGRALPLVQTYILDQNQQPVPVGIGGELCIGGAGLARGYFNRPDLTEEKFIPNPFNNQPGARLYKTGDLVRYLPDGNIEFLGRLDNQVKIRGFRIELGEISSVLAQHPGIRETIVIAPEDVPGNQRLVAYLVPNQEPAPTITDLRRFLKEQLPEYMVPSAFVLLDTLPLTANGKVDQRALPAPETVTSQLENAFVVPRDTLELQLTQIWEKILDVSSIGVTDNFFELGGHSFLAVRLLAQIQKQFGQNLPLTTVFHGATIEQLASILRQRRGNTSWSPLVEIQPSGSKRPFFCVHPVGGHILSYIDLGRYLGPDQPFYGLQSKGLDGQYPPYTQVEDMAAHYIEAIHVVQPQGPYMLGGWSLGGVVAFEMAQQLERQGHKVGLLVLLDTWVPACTDKNSHGKFDDTALHNHFAKDLGGRFGKNLSISYDALGQFTHDEQLNYILEQAKLAAIIPPDVGLMQIRPLAEVYKTNIQALQSYVPQVYPNRITFFQAKELLSEDLSDSVLGWDKLTSESVETYTVPGNHGTMLSLPYVQDLSLQLRRCLDQAQANDDHTDF